MQTFSVNYFCFYVKDLTGVDFYKQSYSHALGSTEVTRYVLYFLFAFLYFFFYFIYFLLFTFFVVVVV